jgi:hypothetical protein
MRIRFLLNSPRRAKKGDKNMKNNPKPAYPAYWTTSSFNQQERIQERAAFLQMAETLKAIQEFFISNVNYPLHAGSMIFDDPDTVEERLEDAIESAKPFLPKEAK